MLYAIMRHEKIKSWAALSAMAGHHTRTRPTPNADPATPNRWLVGEACDTCQAVRSRIGTRKVRSNAVLAIEVVLTATPDFFRPGFPDSAGLYDSDRLAAFERQAMDWLRRTFGAENLVSAIVHLDESTPHIHAVVVPIDPDTDRLSASRWLDGKKKLSALQDSFADACRPLGLSRGLKGSQATHTRVSAFYGAVNAAEEGRQPVSVTTPPVMMKESVRRAWADEEASRIDQTLQPLSDVAAMSQIAKRKQREAEATAHAAQEEMQRMRREATRVRDIPLEDVLLRAGYERDTSDSRKWHGIAGHISIETRGGRAKFFNHDAGIGGGGAIDLVMHVTGFDFKGAVAWLGAELSPSEAVGAAMARAKAKATEAVRLPVPTMPEPVKSTWPKVRAYLTGMRKISAQLVDFLHERGVIYADAHANAVFNYSDKVGAGAELRGTGDVRWRGFRGKKEGGFWIKCKGSSELAICESAIEALSYVELFGQSAVSISGVSTAAATTIAKQALAEGKTVKAAFNADQAGEMAAERLIQAVPAVLRATPTLKDWNEDLRARTVTPAPAPASHDERLGL